MRGISVVATLLFALSLGPLFVSSGCGKKKMEDEEASGTTTTTTGTMGGPAAKKLPLEPGDAAITGTVTYSGTPPELASLPIPEKNKEDCHAGAKPFELHDQMWI